MKRRVKQRNAISLKVSILQGLGVDASLCTWPNQRALIVANRDLTSSQKKLPSDQIALSVNVLDLSGYLDSLSCNQGHFVSRVRIVRNRSRSRT